MVEVGGQGGVYHHSTAVAEALQEAGFEVTFHTAVDAEPLGVSVEHCTCMKWSRRPPSGIRQPITAARFLLVTVRHLVATSDEHGVIHIQGQFGPLLTEWLMRRLTRAGRRVVWSPHNTFARSGKKRHERSIARMAGMAAVCIAFSESDHERLEQLGGTVRRADLVHALPVPSQEEVAAMRKRFGGEPSALLAGQVRADKRPDVFVRACHEAGVHAAIIGPALDGEELVHDAAQETGTTPTWIRGYVPLNDFVAALCATDVVVATHRIGSVSGPLSMAVELGIRTVAPVTGGLAEQVTVSVNNDDTASFATAIKTALDLPRPEPQRFGQVGEQHLAAYEAAGWVSA